MKLVLIYVLFSLLTFGSTLLPILLNTSQWLTSLCIVLVFLILCRFSKIDILIAVILTFSITVIFPIFILSLIERSHPEAGSFITYMNVKDVAKLMSPSLLLICIGALRFYFYNQKKKGRNEL